jgi:pimeloyl-ACP methyl ester carboxylesterase
VRKLLIGAVAVLLVGYGGTCAYLWSQQRELIFFPTRDLRASPADLGLAYEESRIPVGADPSVTLHAWWLPAAEATAPVFLYLHGNDLNIGSDLERIARLGGMGYAVLAVDYRGYGSSGGEFPSEARMYEDAEAAWRYVTGRLRAAPRDVFIYGHSLGGAVAAELALRHPEAAGLVVESTFTSLPDMASIAFWMFPVDALLHQRFDTLARIPHVRVPALFIHGTADSEVQSAMSERLHAAAGGVRQLLLIPGAGHDDAAAVGGTAYAHAVREFTQRARDRR